MKSIKGGFLVLEVWLSLILVIPSVFAACSLNVSLINQDPYPAIPGDYVKIVFQVSGVENPECKGAMFGLVLKYPFSADEDTDKILPDSSYVPDYNTAWMIPYKIRIDENALNGENELEVKYKIGREKYWDSYLTKKFNITIEDVRADFEVSIKNYDKTTKMLAFEILNTGKNDAEAVTIEIPRQENITVRKNSKKIIGSLDANEDTTFEFEAVPREGEINLIITYTDKTNVRRTLEKKVFFDPEQFPAERKSYVPYYIIGILIIAIVLYLFFKRRKRKA